MNRNTFLSTPSFIAVLATVGLVVFIILAILPTPQFIQELYWAQTLRPQIEQTWGLRLTPATARFPGRHALQKVYTISYVEPGSLAERRGFKVGDIPLGISEGTFYWVLSQSKNWPNPHVLVINKADTGDGWWARRREIELAGQKKHGN
jgi:hypothetical protein